MTISPIGNLVANLVPGSILTLPPGFKIVTIEPNGGLVIEEQRPRLAIPEGECDQPAIVEAKE